MINLYRKAIYNACSTVGIPVYDYWVIDKTYPYIIISGVGADEVDYKMNTRQEYIITIDVFDKSKGKSAIVNYTDEIKTNLKAIDGVNVRVSTRYFSDVEPNVMHAVLTLQFSIII